jgi:hypothetical protein
MDLKAEKEFVSLLEERLRSYQFIKNEMTLSGRVHYVNFLFSTNGINYNFFVRLLPKLSELEVYLKVEYTALSKIVKQIDNSTKFQYTFTEKLADFLEPENADWFNNATCLENEKIHFDTEQDMIDFVDYLEMKYLKVLIEQIIPKTNSLEKLNALLNDYDLVYDKKNDEPKMYVLSGGMIFQSISALLLNTIFENPKRDELIKMYAWLFHVIKDEEDIDKVMIKKVLDYVALNPPK